MQDLPDIQGQDIANKHVILRLDLNVPVDNNGSVTDYTRINRAIPTIQYLRQQKARVTIITHYGRPKGKVVKELSTQFLQPVLSDLLKEQVEFQSDIDKAVSGNLILLENVRFWSGEERNDVSLAEKIAALGNIYVNDAFACCHRGHSSISAITKFLPSFAGLLIKEEVRYLSSIGASKPMTAIIGGKKVSTKFDVMLNLSNKIDNLVIGGAMVNTFLKAMGKEIGESYYEPDLVSRAQEFLKEHSNCKIVLPKDVIVQRGDNTAVVSVDHVQASDIIFDLGPESVLHLNDTINNSQMIIWNGPLGFFENPKYMAATQFLAALISKKTLENKVLSIAGGGDIVAALNICGLANNFSYISTAGGAFLEWLEGKELPGIKALLQQ